MRHILTRFLPLGLLLAITQPAPADFVESGFSVTLPGFTTFRAAVGDTIRVEIDIADTVRVPGGQLLSVGRRFDSALDSDGLPFTYGLKDGVTWRAVDEFKVVGPIPESGLFVRYVYFITETLEGQRDTLLFESGNRRIAVLPADGGSNSRTDHTNADFSATLLPPTRFSAVPGQVVNFIVKVEDAATADAFDIRAVFDARHVGFKRFLRHGFLGGLSLTTTVLPGAGGIDTVTVRGQSRDNFSGSGSGSLGLLQFEVKEEIPAAGTAIELDRVVLAVSTNDADTLDLAGSGQAIELVPTPVSFANRDVRVALNPTDVPASQIGETIPVGLFAEGMKGVTQFDATFRVDPPDAFDIVRSAFRNQLPGFVNLERIESDGEGRLTVAGATLSGSGASGDLLLGHIELTPADGFDPFSTTLSLEVLSLGASANERDLVYPQFDNEVRFVAESPLGLDFDLADGDQGRTAAGDAEAGDLFEVQIVARDAPRVTGWSALIEYDPEALTYVDGSFVPGDFLPGLLGLADQRSRSVEVGGAVLGGDQSQEGTGVLGTLRFAVGRAFADSALLALKRVKFNLAAGGRSEINVSEQAVIRAVPVAPFRRADFDGDGEVGFGDFFQLVDAFGSTDPRFDLDGDGEVGFGDFFQLVDAFGPEERGKLVDLAERHLGLPQVAALDGIYPNPFNPDAVLPYTVGVGAEVRLDIFAVNGQHVRTLVDQWHAPGRYRAAWDGTDGQGRTLATGVYIARLKTPLRALSQKITLLR